MIAMAERPPSQTEFYIDFSEELPDWDGFPLFWLKKRWRCSLQHLHNLVMSGDLKVPLDLRLKASSRAMIRVPRKSLLAFLNERKDLESISEASPQPQPRNKKADPPSPRLRRAGGKR